MQGTLTNVPSMSVTGGGTVGPEVPAGAAPPGGATSSASSSGPSPAGAPGPGGAGPANSGTPPAWAETLANLVLNTVDKVKVTATLKVVTALRLVVYGVIIVTAALTGLILGLLGVVRIWDVYIPIDPVGRRVWLGYVVFGGVLFLAGAWLLASSRGPKKE